MSKPYLPEELAKQVEQWEAEGYEVLHNHGYGDWDIQKLVESTLFDIEREFSWLEVVEYATCRVYEHAYIIVKCKRKGEPDEKNNN